MTHLTSLILLQGAAFGLAHLSAVYKDDLLENIGAIIPKLYQYVQTVLLDHHSLACNIFMNFLLMRWLWACMWLREV